MMHIIAAIVRCALTPPAPAQHHAALLEIEDARELLPAAELIDVVPAVNHASRFLALTAVRFAAASGARWNEIEDRWRGAIVACAGRADEVEGSEEARCEQRSSRSAVATSSRVATRSSSHETSGTARPSASVTLAARRQPSQHSAACSW